MIIETSLRDIKRMPVKGRHEKGGSVKAQTEQRNKLTRFDPRNVKGNIELFQHINEIQSLKLRKMFDQSDSLRVKKKKKAGKYAGIMEDFGIKILANEEDEEYLRESPKLLGTTSDLPDTFKQHTFEGRMAHLQKVEEQAHVRTPQDNVQPKKKKELSLVEKKKQEEHAKHFKHKFIEALARKFRMLAENEILMKSYLEEKRKLEYQILRDNRKNNATQRMIDSMYGDANGEDHLSPRPQYRFE